MDKIRVKKIIFKWSESSTICEGEEHTSWESAAEAIRRAAQYAPSDGSYDKTAFEIEFEDGETYGGRFDIQRRHTGSINPIGTHAYNWLRFVGGLHKPDWMSDDEYARSIDHHEQACPGITRDSAEFLEKHDLGVVYPDSPGEDD